MYRLPPDPRQRVLLAEQVGIVRDGLAASRTATATLARALLAIHDGELYRVAHGTFEGLCRAEFDLTRSRAYQLLAFARVVENVGADNSGRVAVPKRESHARLLAALPPGRQVEAARLVQETLDAEGRSQARTADFAQAVRTVGGKAENPNLQDTQTPPSLCRWICERLADAGVRPKRILDPCAGNGNLTRPFAQADVVAYEIRQGRDFFRAEKLAVDLVICNPPWKDALRWLQQVVQVAGNRTPTVFICPVLFFIGYKDAAVRRYLESPAAPVFNHLTPLPSDTFVKVYCPGAILWLNLPGVRNVALVPGDRLVRSNDDAPAGCPRPVRPAHASSGTTIDRRPEPSHPFAG